MKRLTLVVLILVSSVSLAAESQQPQPFEEPGIVLGIGFAGDERIYLEGKGVFFYGFEASLDLQGYSSSITLGVVGSFEFYPTHTGNVLMVAEPGLRLGALIKISDELWIHPYGVAGSTILSMVVENKCDIDGACYGTQYGFFAGAGTGLRWMIRDYFGLSADVVFSYSYGHVLCVKVRAGVVFSF